MIDVKKELRQGGVAGMFRALGLNEAVVREHGEPFDGDLAAAWNALEDPILMATMALELGVSGPEVVVALQNALRLSLAEREEATHEVAAKVLDAVEAGLEDIDNCAFTVMQAVILEAGKWMAMAKDDGEAATPWDSMSVVGASSCAQAVLIVACPQCGGDDHRAEMRKVIADICFAVGYGRVLHSEKVGRIPKGGSDQAKRRWADKYTADHFRAQVPVELLLAGPTLMIPTVTPEGVVRRVRRPRGQA